MSSFENPAEGAPVYTGVNNAMAGPSVHS